MTRKNFTPNPEAIADAILKQAGETGAASGKATITATLNAYINPEYSWMQNDYLNAMKDGDHARAINAVSLTTSERKECVFMGKATVTLETVGGDTIKTGMISALKEQRAEVLATAQAKATQIDAKIQNLLAIEFTPA